MFSLFKDIINKKGITPTQNQMRGTMEETTVCPFNNAVIGRFKSASQRKSSTQTLIGLTWKSFAKKWKGRWNCFDSISDTIGRRMEACYWKATWDDGRSTIVWTYYKHCDAGNWQKLVLTDWCRGKSKVQCVLGGEWDCLAEGECK